MTKHNRLERKLLACLEQAESAKEMAQKAIKQIRARMEGMEDYMPKETYRRQLRHLRSVVRSCKSEIEALTELLRMLRGETPKVQNTRTPPPPPTTIRVRVRVPTGLQITEAEIKRLVLQTLNGYAKETER
jgi:hypothetical protein